MNSPHTRAAKLIIRGVFRRFHRTMKRAKGLSGAPAFQRDGSGEGANGLREINHEMRQQKGRRSGYLKGKKAIASTGHYEKAKKKKGEMRLVSTSDDDARLKPRRKDIIAPAFEYPLAP